jgi:predicted nucleic acid-binding protein
MKSTIIDAGPLIALFNRNDKYNTSITAFLKDYTGRLICSWPVITEVSHILSFNTQTQIDFLSWIKLGGIQLVDIDLNGINRMIELSKKNSDVPLDLADASLVVIAEGLNIKEIITIDSDYYIYRTVNKEMLKNIFI